MEHFCLLTTIKITTFEGLMCQVVTNFPELPSAGNAAASDTDANTSASAGTTAAAESAEAGVGSAGVVSIF